MHKPASLLIRNARLIDGNGAPPRAPCSIRIRAGRIAEIARELPAGVDSVLDVAGATVMPGLIDPHVHLQAVPGATFRRDNEDRLWEARLHHLRAYLACGVTTVLDAAIAAPVLREIRRHLDSGGVGPRYLALAVLRQQSKRPCLRKRDRILWAILSRIWSNCRSALLIVQPDTVRKSLQGTRAALRAQAV